MEGFLIGLCLGLGIWWYASRTGKLEKQKRAKIAAQYDVTSTENQKRFVSEVEFHPKRPVNKEAYSSVLLPLEQALSDLNAGYRYFCEVSMGSFLGTKNKSSNGKREDRAFQSINSKRVVFLIVDKFGMPALVIEYQGSGHYQGNAVDRDQVKKLALKSANINLLEVAEGDHGTKVKNSIKCVLTQMAS